VIARGATTKKESSSVPTALLELARHNAWATHQLLDYCERLDESILNATASGTYGSVIDTLRHLIDSESSYLFRLSGAWSTVPRPPREPVGFDALRERTALLAETWETFLASDFDTEKLGEARGGDGAVFAVRATIYITQAIHHANEHRTHICTILGRLGLEPPDVSAWGYALASGRSWGTTEPTAS
jgi:uncharacterized damage-inducible protein DinB